MRRKNLLFLVVMFLTFLCLTLGLMWFYLPQEAINDGAAIFAIALTCAAIAICFFVGKNESNIKALAQEGDIDALKRMLLGKRP